MKNIGFLYTSDRQFEELIKANSLSTEREYLIRIHSCIHTAETIKPFISKILSYLPASKIIGSSTSGVIFEGAIHTKCCLVSITEFNNAHVKTHIENISGSDSSDISGNEVAEAIINSIVTDRTKFMLTFASRQYMKIVDFVNYINESAPGIQMLGGMANTPQNPLISIGLQTSYAFTEKEVSLNAIACAAVDMNKVSIYSDVIYVTEPIGSSYTVTEMDGMILRSVDGKNAVDWYQEVLGINLNDTCQGYNTTILFPIVKEDYCNIPWAITYSPQDEREKVFPDEPEPVMYVLTGLKAGDSIRISYSSLQKTIDVCENVCEAINKHPGEVLFGYSCVSRQDMFSNCAEWELLPFEKTNLCGALVAGEIGNIGGCNYLCNYSFAIASVAESNSIVKLNIDKLRNNSYKLISSNDTIIDYLNSKHEDKIASRYEIENSLFKDDDTGLNNITKFSFDCNHKKFDKMCMIAIVNERILKAFMSSSKFTIYFRHYLSDIMQYIDNKRYGYYIYKETSLLITADPEIGDQEFLDSMSALQDHISQFKFSSYVPVSEFAVVMHEEDFIKKAELTLVNMRNKKISLMQYTPELGLEQFNAHKMKMVSIINEAIANDGIVPYFQGIRNNVDGKIKFYESLMRIEDSEGNVYAPFAFLDIAREYGYYTDISYIMINKVMQIFKDREEQVTINLNINDIYNYKIVHSILKFLKTAPHPENYVFELTETEEIDNYQVINEFVEQVHQSGGKIAIDDFGSGFSNMVHVFKINSDFIKIDGEIVKNICSDVYALEFLEMIATWSAKHNKDVIAEFIENQDIQDLVEKYNIKFSQGYLYSKPSKLFQ